MDTSRIEIALACLAVVTTSTVPAVAQSPPTDGTTNPVPGAETSAEPADRDEDGRFELRAGGEVLPAQAIWGFREYSLSENGVAYGGFAAGFINATRHLWLGIGASFAGLHGEGPGPPHGPTGGWLLHIPVLLELGFPVGTPGSRVAFGLEIGGLIGKLTNMHQAHLTDPTVHLRGRFLGLRGGYVLAIADDLALGGLLGVRAGTVSQTDPDAEDTQGMLYLSIAFQLGLHFQP